MVEAEGKGIGIVMLGIIAITAVVGLILLFRGAGTAVHRELDLVHYEIDIIHKELDLIHKEFELTHDELALVHQEFDEVADSVPEAVRVKMRALHAQIGKKVDAIDAQRIRINYAIKEIHSKRTGVEAQVVQAHAQR